MANLAGFVQKIAVIATKTITFNLVNKIKSCLDSLASSTEGRDAAVDTDSGVEVNPSPVKG